MRFRVMNEAPATPAPGEPGVEDTVVERVPAPIATRPAPAASTGALVLPATGVYALATMSDGEFEARKAAMIKGRQRAKEIMRACMVENVHYGKVPGRENDPEAQHGLRKPGAEVLLSLYNYVADPQPVVTYGDPLNVESPAIRVACRCPIHAGNLDGPIVGVGVGASSSWEIKYRYRNAQRECPACQKTTIMRSKFEKDRGPFAGTRPWWCNARAGGCGEEFAQDDERITTQQVGRVGNEDAADLENTLVKMAAKRAKVDGTINATNTSDLFTQDVEDLADQAFADGAKNEAAATGGTTKPAAAAPAAPAKPANGQALPASEGQIKFIRGLMAKKLGIVYGNDAAILIELRRRNWADAWPGLTSKQASHVIGELKPLADRSEGEAPAGATPTAAPAAGQTTMTDEQRRTAYFRRINDLIAKIHHVQPRREFFVEHEGIEYLTDLESLKVLALKDVTATDTLSLEELERLGKYLSFQPGAAPVSPAASGGQQ